MGFYKPPMDMVRKIKRYDPHLFVEWDNKHWWWNIWVMMPHGRRLVTPVTESIYDTRKPRKYTPLDDRIIAWLYHADSWRYKDGDEMFMLNFHSDLKAQIRAFDKFRSHSKEVAKEVYDDIHRFTFHKPKPKNPKYPNFNKAKKFGKWVRPDVRANTSPRVFKRSPVNIRRKFG